MAKKLEINLLELTMIFNILTEYLILIREDKAGKMYGNENVMELIKKFVECFESRVISI